MPSWRESPRQKDLVLVTSVVGQGAGEILGRVPAAARSSLQYLLARVEREDAGLPQSIAVTSAIEGEGVSFISRGLAAVLAVDLGKRTCLVDANWWEGDDEVEHLGAGLAGVARGQHGLSEVVMSTHYERLSFIPRGSFPDDDSTPPVVGDVLKQVLGELRERFDHVILDLPALDVSSTTMRFAGFAEAAILVVRQGSTRSLQVERALADIQHKRMLGVVLNDNQLRMPRLLQRRLLDA